MMNDIDRIREALQFIQVGGNHERWRVAAMIYSEVGEAGRELWDEWRGDRGHDDAASTWRSASKHGSLKIGTLFHEAKVAGWRDDGRYKRPTPEELAERRRDAAERADQERSEREARQTEAAKLAALIYGKASRHDVANHPYAVKKRVDLLSLVRRGAWPQRGWNDALLIPLYDFTGKLVTVEAINGDGEKDYLAGGRKSGSFFPFGKLRGATVVMIGEGAATVAAGVDATSWPAAAAMDAGNLLATAQAVRKLAPEATILILADNDVRDDGRNPGVEAARTAAEAVGGFFTIPELDGRACDWWDVWSERGAEVVYNALQATLVSPAEPTTADDASHESTPACRSDGDSWPDPQSLASKVEPEPYPLDALPDTIRAAVSEVAGFVKAPIAVVASSALAALSLAIQAHADVKRLEKLHGPVGLFLLTIADSGERKSTCDGFFVSVISQYQEGQAEAMKPAVKEYQAAIAAWEAEREGIIAAIKQAGRTGK